MSVDDKVYLGTRKGLFTIERKGDVWDIVDVAFLGDPVTLMMEDPRDGTRFACLTTGHFGAKLWRLDPGETEWKECASPVYPEGLTLKSPMAADPNAEKPASLSEIWELTPGGLDHAGRIWAGTIPGGLFRSDDRGDRWQFVQSLWDCPERAQWFGGGKDDPGIHSICVDPRNSDHLTLAVSCGGVWESLDAGESWECVGDGLRAEYMPPELANDKVAQDPHRMRLCHEAPDTMWIQHHNGIFRSTDAGRTWNELQAEPATFGFAVASHPQDSQTAWFIPGVADECRVPVDAQLVVTRTRDGGQTFEALRSGLPQEHCYDIVFRHALDVNADGQRLCFGTTTGNVFISSDSGERWSRLSAELPLVYCVQFALV